MTAPINVTIPHQLGRAEARRRIEAGFAKLVATLPGSPSRSSDRWDGDRLIFSLATMGQTIAGVIDVRDAVVLMEVELPSWVGVIARGFKDRLQKAAQLLLTNS